MCLGFSRAPSAWAFLVALLCLPAHSDAQEAAPTIRIPRVATPPRIDDYLTGDSHPGLAVTDFRQRSPLDLAPVSQPTTTWLSFDDDHLYVVFVCRMANPEQVRARMSRRESAFSDDQVGLYLDTFLDRQRSYVFLVNPLGIQTDGIQSEGAVEEDYSFDTQWRAEGRVTSTGYVVWMAIPFKRLRFSTTGGNPQRWGVALKRSIPANSEESYFPAISENVSGFATQFATLEGLDGVRPGRSIQLIPYGTFTTARLLDADRSRYRRDHDPRAGIDTKFVVRDAVTVDLTANPDFSEVESDEPQVTINERFEVFFPEKRPFFLENADLFATPQTLFFSRRIRDPQLGARVTGKAGAWAFGGLAIDDRAPGRTVGTAFDGHRAASAVGRARFDFGGGSRIGALGTRRTFGGAGNDVVSVDARLRLNPRWLVTGQFAGSRSTTGGSDMMGAASYLDVSRSGRALFYNLTYSDASPGFRTQLGFVPRVDVRQTNAFMSWRWRPSRGPVVSYGPNLFVNGVWNYRGELQDWRINAPFRIDLKARSFVFVRRAELSETVRGIELRQHENFLEFNSEYLPALTLHADYIWGTRPNYAPAGGQAAYLASYDYVYVSAGWRPTSSLLVDETYIQSRLSSRPGPPGTGPIFSNHILRSRVNYQFSRAWSLRAIVDYNTVDANLALIDLPRSRRVVSDLLVTWLRTPGTALYIGYTDGYDNVRVDPEHGVVPTDRRLISTGRQVFVKCSWLLAF